MVLTKQFSLVADHSHPRENLIHDDVTQSLDPLLIPKSDAELLPSGDEKRFSPKERKLPKKFYRWVYDSNYSSDD